VAVLDDIARVESVAVVGVLGEVVGGVQRRVLVEFAHVDRVDCLFDLLRAVEPVFAERFVVVELVIVTPRTPAPAPMAGPATIFVGAAAVGARTALASFLACHCRCFA